MGLYHATPAEAAGRRYLFSETVFVCLVYANQPGAAGQPRSHPPRVSMARMKAGMNITLAPGVYRRGIPSLARNRPNPLHRRVRRLGFTPLANRKRTRVMNWACLRHFP